MIYLHGISRLTRIFSYSNYALDVCNFRLIRPSFFFSFSRISRVLLEAHAREMRFFHASRELIACILLNFHYTSFFQCARTCVLAVLFNVISKLRTIFAWHATYPCFLLIKLMARDEILFYDFSNGTLKNS